MRYKTKELEGTLLDAAVALAGDDAPLREYVQRTPGGPWPFCRPYSTEWIAGGEVIERELISLVASMSVDMMGPLEWSATVGAFEHYIDESLPLGVYNDNSGSGPTPLVAAMRAFAQSRLGAEVDL